MFVVSENVGQSYWTTALETHGELYIHRKDFVIPDINSVNLPGICAGPSRRDLLA